MAIKINSAAAGILNGRRLVLALFPLFISACSSNQPLPIPGLKESFHTEIAANGAKRFTYSLEMQRRDIPAPYTNEGASRNRMAGGSMVTNGRPPQRSGRNPLQFDRALKRKLTETGFCRDGYFELDRTLSTFGGEVRGECREGAR